ncbi:MAG: PAS domain-containing sensor histidine kinase, partial [Candidatus Heimdallarchaeota archaeon]|nr:PAS domain-containing sensor histidine kinase [Candidatus Heimdallarchaeota archaeon]
SQLEKSEDKYHKMFTTANDAIFILRGDKFTDCNEKTLEMFRCKRDEIIGHPPYEFSPENQPGGNDSYSEAMKKINAALEGEPQFFEWVHKRGDDSLFFAEVSLNKLDYMHGENSIIAVVRDISKRKETEKTLIESEERFRLLFKHAPTGIYELVMDPELGLPVFSTVNDVLLEYTGYTEEEFLNLNFSDILTEESLNHFIDRMDKVRKGERIPNDAEFEIITKDGDHIWVLINAKWFYKDNVRTRATVIAHNITETKENERLKAEMARKRSDFMAITSHELRTPLAIIKGYLDILHSKKGKMTEEEIESSLKRAQKNVDRLENLITGVSELTRIERGIFSLNRKTTDLRIWLAEIMLPYKDILSTNLTFTYDTDYFPTLLELDQNRMTQVLSNLVQNAINHTSSTDRKITVECLTQLPDKIRITVMDNGAGIPKNKQEEIFEPFVSIQSQYSVQGTGIGLYISRIIIEGHEGKIWAKNGGIDGKGATFTIEIPKKSQ